MFFSFKKCVWLCLGLIAGLSAPLGWAADSELDKLKASLAAGPEYKRILSIQSLSRYSTPEVHALITHAMLYDHATPVRRAAQRALANVDDPQIVAALIQAVETPERRVRLAALEALGLVRDASGADLILKGIQKDPGDLEMTLVGLQALREFVYRTEPNAGFEKKLTAYLPPPKSWWIFTRHDQSRIQKTALTVLGILARPGSLPDLMPLWERADNKAKVFLADAFANIGWQPPVPLLIRGLQAKDADVVIHSLYALGHIQAFSALGPIRNLLEQSRNARVQMAGIQALIAIPEPENAAVMIKFLKNNDLSVRHWAAYGLGALGAKQTAPILLQQLDDPSSLVRATAVIALSALNYHEAEPKLLNILSDEKQPVEVRVATAKALMTLKNTSGVDVYWKELHSKELEWDARLQYALALGNCRNNSYRERLADELGSSHFPISFSAALALGVMGNSQAVPLLIQSLDHGSPLIRQYAILGLEAFKFQEVLSALASTANEDWDPVVRILCAARLAASGYPEYRVMLWNCLDNSKEDIRSEALIGLGRSADPMILKQLKWYLRREPSIPVRETIWRILREAEKSRPE